MSYVVSLKQFDGPLDLLLTLISRAKISITDIFLSEITEQYLSSIEDLSELDMDSASEFLQMAATLLEIKSRALLPIPPRDDEGEESPEEALIRQLQEYKAFKELSQEMQVLEKEAKLLLTKLPEEYPLPPPTFELSGMTLEGLTKAFARVLMRIEAREGEVHEPREVRRDSYTMHNCMSRIQTRVRKSDVMFSELFEGAPGKDEVISVFLALLELLKLGRVKITQKHVYDDIRVRKSA
ncbi:segregation/condensation protein A [Eubacteriales bacterium OttesenSCG-928-N13]|nr:segregation/condensation protein A [Eubacteriales bacterium OttesenSCG-928-N13]